jgi:hypothetical protein
MRHSTLAAILLLCPVTALAQICTPTDTTKTCRKKIDDWYAISGAEPTAEASAKSAIVAANTGSVDQPANPTNSVTDFNPLVQMAADSGGIGNDDQAITINFNNFIDLPLPDYQAKVILRHPKLNESIVTELRAAGADAGISELEDGFNDFDDPTLSISYSPVKKNMGRNPTKYSDVLNAGFNDGRSQIERTATALVSQAGAEYGQAFLDVRTALIANRKLTDSYVIEDKTFHELESDAGPKESTRLREATETLERAGIERLRALNNVLAAGWFYNLVDLIDNQPQLFISVQANSPDELVGPSTISAKITWEKGWVNINGLRTKCGDEPSLACLGTYLDEGTNRAALERGDRIALSLEYKKIDDYNVTLPDDGITINAPHDSSIVGSFTYARYLKTAKPTLGKPRVDVAIQYENVDNATLRQDRFVATATFSQKLGDSSILSFGVVYANKPEFRGEVDKQISARLGINYKLGGRD